MGRLWRCHGTALAISWMLEAGLLGVWAAGAPREKGKMLESLQEFASMPCAISLVVLLSHGKSSCSHFCPPHRPADAKEGRQVILNLGQLHVS